jgi:hypothetical protein
MARSGLQVAALAAAARQPKDPSAIQAEAGTGHGPPVVLAARPIRPVRHAVRTGNSYREAQRQRRDVSSPVDAVPAPEHPQGIADMTDMTDMTRDRFLRRRHVTSGRWPRKWAQPKVRVHSVPPGVSRLARNLAIEFATASAVAIADRWARLASALGSAGSRAAHTARSTARESAAVRSTSMT